MKKDVIFYIPSLGSGGAERQCAYFASFLQKVHDCSCTIIVTHGDRFNSENLRRVQTAGVLVKVLAWYKPSDFCRLFKYFHAHKKATLFCYQTFPNFFGTIIGRIAGLRNCYGGVRVSWLPFRFMLMEYIVHYLFSRKTIFNSYRGKDMFVAKHFRQERCIVVSNAIEPPRIRKDYGKVSDSARVITVGRFKPSKDYLTWIRVIKNLVSSGVKIEPVIIGYGQQERDIHRWIDDNGLSEIIKVLPGNNVVNVQAELAASDIYLSTSIFEGTSNSVMEAMNAGLPVVATDVGDNDYLIENGKTGYICPVRDVTALASAVKRLVDDNALRRTFGERAIARIEKNHSVPGIVGEYLKIIEQDIDVE